jgi:hypothetical protein
MEEFFIDLRANPGRARGLRRAVQRLLCTISRWLPPLEGPSVDPGVRR